MFNLPSSSGMINISKKGIEPSALGSSYVKRMLSLMELMCSRKASLSAFWMMVKVSSTNLFQILGVDGAVARAFVSRSSMNRLATMGLSGDPMAAPLTCSYIFPWNVKYVVLRQNFSKQMI